MIAAYLGRGTAYALSGELDKAINDFSSAIVLDSKCVEAWKVRSPIPLLCRPWCLCNWSPVIPSPQNKKKKICL